MEHSDDEHVDTEWREELLRCAVCRAPVVMRQRRFRIVPEVRYLSARCAADVHHDLTPTPESLAAMRLGSAS